MIRRHCEVSSQRTPKQLPQVWSSSTSFLFLLVLIYRYDYWYLQPIFSSLVDITVDWYHHLTTLRGGGWRRTGRCWLTQTQEQPTPGLSWCSTHGLPWCSTHGLLFSQNCWTAGVGGQKLFWQCPKRWDDIYKVASLTLLWGIPQLFYTCFHVVHINGNCLCIKGVIPGKREALLWNLFVLHFSPILWIWQRLHPMHILPTFENIAV